MSLISTDGTAASLRYVEYLTRKQIVVPNGRVIDTREFTPPTTYVVVMARELSRTLATREDRRRAPEPMRKLLQAASVGLALAALCVVPANALSTIGGGDVGGGGVQVAIRVDAPGSPGTSNGASGARSQRPVLDLTWTVPDPNPTAVAGSLEGLCFLPSPGAPNAQPGFQYRVVGTNSLGEVVVDTLECVPFADGDTSAVPAPPTLPALPSFEEAWASAHIPPPDIHTDPEARGITGLETRIWTTGTTTVVIATSVRGYTITGTATLDHYMISVDGGDPTRADNDRFTFETKGKHKITIAAVWRGRATLGGNDLEPPVDLGDIGTATITTERDYQVNEIRSVLQP